MTERKNDELNPVEEATEELLTDPDSPAKGNSTPPQTIDAEPTDER